MCPGQALIMEPESRALKGNFNFGDFKRPVTAYLVEETVNQLLFTCEIFLKDSKESRCREYFSLQTSL